MLTKGELAHYREHGYVVVGCPFDVEDREHLLALAKDNLDLSNADGVRVSRLDPRYTVADTHQRTLRLLEHPYVVAAVGQIFGSSEFRVFLANWANRTPDVKPQIHWHTDYQEPKRDLGLRVEVSWYLTPSTRENGCLRLVPGSQRVPTNQTCRELVLAGRQQGKYWRSCEVVHPLEMSLPLGPDQLLIRDGFVWHCTYENTTGSIRYMYGWSYAPLPERLMLVDYELFLPASIVECPTPTQAQLFALDEGYRKSLVDRFGEPVRSLSERLGYERDREWRASKHYAGGEDVRFENA
jgi:ectoine hydroxylase-related dioxygenase (phytanoyl-CoA dioxygenase family)